MNKIIFSAFVSAIVSCSQPKTDTSSNHSEINIPDSVPVSNELPVEQETPTDTYDDLLVFYENLDALQNLSEPFERVSKLTNAPITEEEFYSDGCVRGIPENSIKKEGLFYHHFALNEEMQLGEELAVFNNYDSLYLLNKGCEYYWIEYFYSMQGSDKSSLSNSFLHALKSISLSDNRSPIGIEDWIAFVETEIESRRQIELNKDYVTDSTMIGSSFIISRYAKTSGNRRFIRFDYSIGPL